MTTDCIVPTGSLPNVLTVSYDENPGADLGLGNGSTIDFEAIRGTGFTNPTLTGGTLTPTLVGDSYRTTVGEVAALTVGTFQSPSTRPNSTIC